MSASPTSQRKGEVNPRITNGMPRKSNGSHPRWRNSTPPICAGIASSAALALLGSGAGLLTGYPNPGPRSPRFLLGLSIFFPWREKRPPLVGDGNRLSLRRNGHIDDRRITDHGALPVSHFLSHDEARVAYRRQASTDGEIIARECLSLIRCFDFANHRPEAGPHVLVVSHVALERRPPRSLEECEHVGMVDVPDCVAVARIDMNRECFGHVDRRRSGSCAKVNADGARHH